MEPRRPEVGVDLWGNRLDGEFELVYLALERGRIHPVGVAFHDDGREVITQGDQGAWPCGTAFGQVARLLRGRSQATNVIL